MGDDGGDITSPWTPTRYISSYKISRRMKLSLCQIKFAVLAILLYFMLNISNQHPTQLRCVSSCHCSNWLDSISGAIIPLIVPLFLSIQLTKFLSKRHSHDNAVLTHYHSAERHHLAIRLNDVNGWRQEANVHVGQNQAIDARWASRRVKIRALFWRNHRISWRLTIATTRSTTTR